MARLHNLKTMREPFRAIWDDQKTAEFRRLDREFAVGDLLILLEWDGENYTGDYIEARITHIQAGFGIPEGFGMLSFEKHFDRFRHSRAEIEAYVRTCARLYPERTGRRQEVTNV